jgi:hypothetical protein
MSVFIPSYIITLTSPSVTYTVTDLTYLKVTKSVSSSIGSFEVKVPHGTNPDFKRYSDLEPFTNITIYLGRDIGSPTPTFSGKIDTIKTEFSSEAGYVSTITGRDLGEVLFRYVVRKNYYGFYNLYPTGSTDLVGMGFRAGRGKSDDGYDVHVLTDKTHLPQGDNGSTILNLRGAGSVGPGDSGYLYVIYPYVTQKPPSFWREPYSTTPDLPDSNTRQPYGMITDRSFSLSGPNCLIQLKYINWTYDYLGAIQPILPHTGFTWVRAWGFDDTGSMSNGELLSEWVCNAGTQSQVATGSEVLFVAGQNNIAYDTILLPFTVQPSSQYIYFEMLWQIITPPSDEYAGLIMDMANSFWGIPTNEGIATNVLGDLISSTTTPMTEITPGNLYEAGIYNSTPITINYDNDSIFDCIKAVCDTINYDFFISPDSKLYVYPRQTNFTSTFLQEGVNILKYNREQDLGNVKNYIWIRGAPENLLPEDGDLWTETSGTGWSGIGTGSGVTDVYDYLNFPVQYSVGSIIGRYSAFFKPHTDPDTGYDDVLPDGSCVLLFNHEISPPIEIRSGESGSLNFYACASYAGTYPIENYVVRLKNSKYDYDNYFQANINVSNVDGWQNDSLHNISMGEQYQKDKVGGTWDEPVFTKFGNPQWKSIKYIEFYFHYNPGNSIPPYPGFMIDGLNFSKIRFSGSAMDQASINKYGFRYYEETSDDYHSDAECLARANRYLYTKKYPINQVTIVTTGSESIDAGDRIKVHAPSDGLTGSDGTGAWFDVIELTHMLSPTEGYITELQLSDQKYVRSISELKNYGVQRYYDKLDSTNALKGLRITK